MLAPAVLVAADMPRWPLAEGSHLAAPRRAFNAAPQKAGAAPVDTPGSLAAILGAAERREPPAVRRCAYALLARSALGGGGPHGVLLPGRALGAAVRQKVPPVRAAGNRAVHACRAAARPLPLGTVYDPEFIERALRENSLYTQLNRIRCTLDMIAYKFALRVMIRVLGRGRGSGPSRI